MARARVWAQIDVDSDRLRRGKRGTHYPLHKGASDGVSESEKPRHVGRLQTRRGTVLGALAALADEAYLAETLENVAASKARIGTIARANGLVPLPSATNFVAIDCGQGAEFAKAVVAALGEKGVFIRMPFSEPQNRCIRVSAGRPEDLDLLERVLPDALALARPQTEV